MFFVCPRARIDVNTRMSTGGDVNSSSGVSKSTDAGKKCNNHVLLRKTRKRYSFSYRRWRRKETRVFTNFSSRTYQFVFAPVDALLQEAEVFVGLYEARLGHHDPLGGGVRLLLREGAIVEHDQQPVFEERSHTHVALLQLHNPERRDAPEPELGRAKAYSMFTTRPRLRV